MKQARLWRLSAAAILGALGGGIAAADLPAGIAAWQAGDYARAISEWRPLAEAGNADAQFNLGQAYRLGRGVPADPRLAEQWFERAARQRHEQAGTNLGLLLFQNGRAREAMPWIQAAANRGDPRAQYVFGTALFNGDIVRRDVPRAYAMMSRAAQQGFPQAAEQLRQMDGLIPAEDRARGLALAQQMGGPAPVSPPAAPPTRYTAVVPTPAPVVARPAPPIERAPVDPPVASPATTPAAPARRVVSLPRPSRPAPTPSRAAAPTPGRAAASGSRRAAGPAPHAAGGGWRIQLGAFSSAAGARRQWDLLRRRVAAVGPLQPAYPSAGALTRLRAGPVGSRGAADRICSAVRAAGADCVPVAPGG